MKKWFILMFAAINLLLTGCSWSQGVTLSDLFTPTVVGRDRHGERIILPSAADDPAANKDVQKNAQRPVASPPRVSTPKVVEDAPPVKAFPPPAANQRPAIQPTSPRMRRGPEMWRAFSRLPQAEQKKLLTLQRTDPENYWRAMQENAQRFYELEKAKRQKMDDLIAQFKQSRNPAEQEKLRNQIRFLLKDDFEQRLQDTRRDIEFTRNRTALLEKELETREKNCDAIVDAMLNKRLTSDK